MSSTFIKPKGNSAKIIRDIAENSWRAINSAVVLAIKSSIQEIFGKEKSICAALNQAIAGSVLVEVSAISPETLEQTINVRSVAGRRRTLLSVHATQQAHLEQIADTGLFYAIYTDTDEHTVLTLKWTEDAGEVSFQLVTDTNTKSWLNKLLKQNQEQIIISINDRIKYLQGLKI